MARGQAGRPRRLSRSLAFENPGPGKDINRVDILERDHEDRSTELRGLMRPLQPVKTIHQQAETSPKKT